VHGERGRGRLRMLSGVSERVSERMYVDRERGGE